MPPLARNERRRLLDEPVALALVALLVIYTSVTVLTYWKIASGDGPLVERHVSAVPQPVSSTTANQKAIEALNHHVFPRHVADNEWEIIPHPGLALAGDLSAVPKDLARTMKVPKFFEETHGAAYGGSIRHYLGGGHRLMTESEAASIGSFVGDLETIYCSIASYRDYECGPTVADLFERAEHPERLRVAIIDQRILDSEEDRPCHQPPQPCDKDPSQTLCRYAHLIDSYEMDARLAVGPVFARHLAHRHYRGEYYAMQVDSHIRMIQDWDTKLVQQWKSAQNEMAVLTTYLSDITGAIDPVTHESRHHTRPIMCESDYEGQGDYKHLRHGQQPEGEAMIKGQPTLHPFWAAGFSFARGHFVIQVPYDQYAPMVFQNEEAALGLRAFTYGYDFYTGEEGVAFHMYASANKERKAVPLFWEHADTYKGVGTKAMKRLNKIIGLAKVNDEDWPHEELDKYGLGAIRTTQKFFKTFGIHPETQTVEHHLCRFVGQPMMRVFMPALRANRMGIDYDKIDYEFKDPAPHQK